MTNNTFDDYNNDYTNSSDSMNPEEYYQETTNKSEDYAKYGEDIFHQSTPDVQDSTVENNVNTTVNSDFVTESTNHHDSNTTENDNPYASQTNSSSYTTPPYSQQNDYQYGTQSSQNTSYSYGTQDYNGSPYNTNPYNPYQTANPYGTPYTTPQKPKTKKESKPITTKALAVALVVCILLSAILGCIGSFVVMKATNPKVVTSTSGNLTINKIDGDSPSKKGDGAVLSTTEIVNKAANSVVEITTEMVVTGSFSQQYIQEGAGSGVIISTDGYIVTNHHVINGASEVSVTLRGENTSIRAEIVGTYEAGDLALIKIDTDIELTAAVFGNSDKLNVGDYAVAIGNPLGQLGGTVTDGIISALDREVDIDGQTMNLLQTNAEISPGNSGGGLFNGNGELIGVVNAKSSTEAAEGLGFAIPINDVQNVLSDLKEFGYVKGQIYLGMTLQDITNTAEAWMYGVSQAGVYVANVNNGSNAEKAGFYSGDRILQVNGTNVSSTAEVDAIIDKLKVGDSVTFKVERRGQTGTLTMVLEEYTNKLTPSGNQQDNDIPLIWDAFGGY